MSSSISVKVSVQSDQSESNTSVWFWGEIYVLSRGRSNVAENDIDNGVLTKEILTVSADLHYSLIFSWVGGTAPFPLLEIYTQKINTSITIDHTS